MKKLALALTATAALASPAFAADMAVKAARPAPVPVAVANWTGCYVGGGVGYGMYDIETRMYDARGAVPVASNRQFDQGGRGWIGSVSGGCDYQFGGPGGQWVIGAFADYNWSDMHGDFTGNGGGVGLVSNTEKVDYYWSVGGRIGWLVTPSVLTYFSGGYTEAHRTGVSNYLTATNALTGVGLRGGTVAGWFLGSGVEYQIGFIPGLTLKTEYRFSQFDQIDNREYTVATGLPTGFFSRDKLYTQTVMSTLSYRFNFGGPAVVAKY
jgi:outer membrane immunogenic protein